MKHYGMQRNIVKWDYILIILFTSLIIISSIGCSGGGSNNDDDTNPEISGKDEDGNNSDLTNIQGLWKIKSITEDLGDGYPVTTDFPYTVEYVNLKIKGYAKITSDSIAFYVGLENLPEGMLYKDGVFFCNEDTKAYTLSDNEIQTDDNEACVVDIVGDQCTFTFLDTVDTESLITISMERSDFSEIYEATENCEIYQTFGL